MKVFDLTPESLIQAFRQFDKAANEGLLEQAPPNFVNPFKDLVLNLSQRMGLTYRMDEFPAYFNFATICFAIGRISGIQEENPSLAEEPSIIIPIPMQADE